MSKNQQKYNARMKRTSYFPPLHATSGYNEYDALKAYFDAMPENWQKTEFSKSIQPSVSKRNVNLDVGDFSRGEPLENVEDETIFDKIFNKDTIQAAVGNVAGNAVNAGFNALLQGNQFDNQKSLQDRAARLNAEAVRMQPELQVEGMKNAGLNPAQVNGTGAPSLQAGAAAGANSTMGNIFMGIADMIAAAKAPSEIEKLLAEKELINTEVPKTEAETKSILEAQIPNIQASTTKFLEEAQNIKNANDVFKARDEFLRDTSLSIWDNYRANLKASGQWDKYPERTKATINSLADGEIEMGVGELEGLNDVINSQGNLSNRDREIYDNLLKMTITRNQMNDKDVIEALTQLPKDQRNELYSRIAKMAAEAYKAMMSGNLDNFHRENEELNAPLWLADNGKERELSNFTSREALQNIWKLFENATQMVPAAIGYGVGKGGFGKTPKAPKGMTGNTPPSSNPNYNSPSPTYPTSAKYPGYGYNGNTNPW